MKIKLLCLALAFTLSTAQAQKFHFGLNLQPALTGSLLHNDGSVPDAFFNELKSNENQAFGYSGYIFTQYTLSSRSRLRLGIGYSQTGYKYSLPTLIFSQPEPTAPKSIVVNYRKQDIILPLLYQYNLGHRNSHFYLITGLEPQINLRRLIVIRSDYPNGEQSTARSEDRDAHYRNLNLNGVFGFGYELAISAKTHLLFQPTFDCNILGTSKSAALNRNFYSLGLNLGWVIQ